MAESASKQTTKQLRVTQIRSGIGGTRRQRETLRTLNLRKMCALIDGLSAKMLLPGRGYDSNELTDKAVESGCQSVIPPRKNRKKQRDYSFRY